MKRTRTMLLLLFTGILLNSCNDDITKVGTSILPPDDFITVYTDTFQMQASTIRLDSIYAKTSDCLLGEMYDPIYGIIKADMICQFYCEEGFTFYQTPLNGKVDSVELLIHHQLNAMGGLSAFGDTLTPMEVTVYPVNKPLNRTFYTHDNPANYCDMLHPLGSATYTLYDLTISDSLRSTGEYTPYIRVKLPTELGTKFYEETINNPATFQNQNAFNAFFPGVYITNTYGNGCLVKTVGEQIGMRIYYSFLKDNNPDSVRMTQEMFYASKDVIQINHFTNSKIEQLLEDNPTHSYVKSPAGVCTKLVLPTSEITKQIDIDSRMINDFTLNLKYLPEAEWDYAYFPPEYLLLLPEDSITTFFEKGNIENNVTSFISFMPYDYDSYGSIRSYRSPAETRYGYTPYNRTYAFGNISRLLKEHITKSPDTDLRLLLVPVTRKTTSYNNAYYTTDISHSFNLSGLKLRIDNDYMKVVILSSKYENRK